MTATGSKPLQPLLITPDWPAPPNVKAVLTTRMGGASRAPFASCNLGLHVGDEPEAVAANRVAVLQAAQAPASVQWLEQVHGTKIVQAGRGDRVLTADGVFTRDVDRVCAVQTADCLPVLLCSLDGQEVAAVHAGWRGLAGGVLRAAVASFSAPPGQLMAYLGPAIGPQAFEVGVDVLEAFFQNARHDKHADAMAAAFRASRKPLCFLADLYQLARAELDAAEVTAVYGGDFCTYTDQQRFYSYRRDGQTGRMASLIWRSH